MADWGGGISVVLHRGSNCPLSRAMDGRIMRRGIISLCQSAAPSEIVKRCCSSLCKQRYSKYSDQLPFYLYFYPIKSLLELILGGYIYPIYSRRYAPDLNVTDGWKGNLLILILILIVLFGTEKQK